VLSGEKRPFSGSIIVREPEKAGALFSVFYSVRGRKIRGSFCNGNAISPAIAPRKGLLHPAGTMTAISFYGL